MLGFQLMLFASVATLGGIYSAPVTQECENCITSTHTRGDVWLRASLKLVDDDLSRLSDYQQLQLESGEEQDHFSRWLYKRQEASRLRVGHLRDLSDMSLRRIKRAPMKKKNSKEQNRGGGKSKENRNRGGGKSKEKRPGKHSHERRRNSHEHKHKHSQEHKHRHSQEHRPRPKPGKHSKVRTTTTLTENNTASTTPSTTTPSATTPSTTTPSTTTLSTTTLSTTTLSTTTPSTITPSITTMANTSQTTTTSTTTLTARSTTPSSTNSPTTTESTTTTTSTTASTTTTPSTATDSTTTLPNTVPTPSTTTVYTTTEPITESSQTPEPTIPGSDTTSTITASSETPEPTTPGIDTTSTPPGIRKRRSNAVLLSPSNAGISISKHHKPSNQSPGKHNKEYSNIKQHGSKRKSPSEKVHDILPNSNILHPLAANSTPYQYDTIENEFIYNFKNSNSFERSSEEEDGIATTPAFVDDPVTQMPDSDEVKSNEDLSTEDYRDIFTNEAPLSIENDSQSAEDVDVTTEEPDKFSSNESYDYYSDEDTSTEDNIIVTTPESLDSNESSSAEDNYQTTVDSKDNNSMESVENIDIPEALTETKESMESILDSIESGLTEDQSDRINSTESIELAINSAEDNYQTTVDSKDNNSMESVENIDIPEALTETTESMESILDSIESGLTEDQSDRINSTESIELAINSSSHIKSKESEEDDEEED